jgi:cytoskeletal protein RodZ
MLGQVTCDPGESTMSEQAVEKRRGLASEIVWVVLYSVLIFLVMLLWVDVPA